MFKEATEPSKQQQFWVMATDFVVCIESSVVMINHNLLLVFKL